MASLGWVIIDGIFQFSGSITLSLGAKVVGVLGFASATTAASDAGISRTGAASIAIGNGTASDASGTILAAKFATGTAAGNQLWKAVGNVWQARDGTDSSFTTVQAIGFTAASNGYTATSRFGLFSISSDGQVQVTNSAGTAGVGFDVATDGTLKLRNRSATAGTGNLDIGAKITAYNQITTAGNGVAVVVAAARSTAQTAAVASVATVTAPAADTSYVVSMNVLVTTSTTHTFTAECAYTDEGNTARTVTMNFVLLAGGALTTSIANGGGAVPYQGIPIQIRAKASTSVTLRTQAAGTYTTVTYNVEGNIRQIN